jgi:hypothetical protein
VSYSIGKYIQAVNIVNTPTGTPNTGTNYITWTNYGTFNPSVGVTVCFWINVNALPASGQQSIPLWMRGSAVNSAVFITLTPTYWGAAYTDGTNYYVPTSSAPLSTGVWYHLTVVVGAGTVVGYQNGVQIASPVAFSNPLDVSGFLYLGGNGNYAPASAIYDDLRIYNTALSAAQVRSVYNQQGVPGRGAVAGPQPKIFLGPLLSYPTATGTPPTNDGTKLSFARESSQYLNFGPQTFDMSQGFSVTCRFAFTGTIGSWERIFDFNTLYNNNSVLLARNSGTNKIRMFMFIGTTAQSVTSSIDLSQSTIYNVTCIFNAINSTLQMYINGILQNTTSSVISPGLQTYNYCYVGSSTLLEYLNGDIYSLNVYNRVLSPNELVGPPAPSPWGIFTATPNGLTSDQAAVSGLALRQGYPGYPSGTYWIKPTSGSVAGLAFVDMTTDGGGWTLAYETVTASRDAAGAITYSINNSSNLSALSFTRVAYSMHNFNSWAFTSFDSWSPTLSAHRIPSDVDAFVNQRRVDNLNVISSNTNVTTGTGLAGALEIWPYNYGQGRNLAIGTYGSDDTYDINDTVSVVGNGHGSFQVHDITNLRPVICWNRHRNGDTAEIGFGPRSSNPPDWTNIPMGSAPPTSDFRVRVFVR